MLTIILLITRGRLIKVIQSRLVTDFRGFELLSYDLISVSQDILLLLYNNSSIFARKPLKEVKTIFIWLSYIYACLLLLCIEKDC